MSVFKRQGRMFIQDDQDDPFWLLTCTGAGDVEMPSADETAVYCPDPTSLADFIIDGTVEGEQGFVTYSMNRPLQSVLNYLITHLHRCRFHAQVEWGTEGIAPSVWTDFILALHLHRSKVSSRTISEPIALSAAEDERVGTSAEVQAYDAWLYYNMTAQRITLTEISAILGLDFLLARACSNEEIGGDLAGKEGYFSTAHTATSPAVSADIWRSDDYGATWAATATDPFGAAEDAGPVVALGDRVVVGRVTTDAGNPAEVGISDDNGATWAVADMGTTNAQFHGPHGLWWEDNTNMWGCTTGGYVYFSNDAGETWTTQSAGTLTVQNLNSICAYRNSDGEYNAWAVGAAAAIIRTTDGVNWEAVVGPTGVTDAFTAVYLLNDDRVLIGSNAGNVYRTSDGGATWELLAAPQWASGEVTDIKGEERNRYTIFISGDDSGSVGEVYRSRDGAASFQEIEDLPVNSGLNVLSVIDNNNAWAAGEVHAGTAFLAKLHETS